MADKVWIIDSAAPVSFRRVKADLLGGPWCVHVARCGDGFEVTHAPTGLSIQSNFDAHVGRRVGDALNRERLTRSRNLAGLMRAAWMIEQVTASAIESEAA